MIAFLEGGLAVLGVVLVLLTAGAWWAGCFAAPAEPDPDPYRDGLDAAARISALGWEAERLLFEVAQDAKREETR